MRHPRFRFAFPFSPLAAFVTLHHSPHTLLFDTDIALASHSRTLFISLYTYTQLSHHQSTKLAKQTK